MAASLNVTAGVDYTHYESNFNYRGGIRQDVLKLVYIPIIDDTIAEPRESFEVTFTPTRNFYLRNNVIKVIICDDDGGTTLCNIGMSTIQPYLFPQIQLTLASVMKYRLRCGLSLPLTQSMNQPGV